MGPELIVCSSSETLPKHLNVAILNLAVDAIRARGVFTIALSGGSLASFLSGLSAEADAGSIDPRFDSWYVILADERCVPLESEDSNMGALHKDTLSKVPIPPSQVYGINQDKLSESVDSIAADYETAVRQVIAKSGLLDLAVLGYGPDGHTCSLFPGHALLEEKDKWVAGIDDSPKPPPSRITLTLPVLNGHTRHAIFCGAGAAKSPVLQKVFFRVSPKDTSYGIPGGRRHGLTLASPPPFPCAQIRPDDAASTHSLLWIVDEAAMEGVPSAA